MVYEQQIVQGYQNFLSNVTVHYSSSGSGHGPEISPYITYVRAGMSQGGEDYPNCTMAGRIPQANWQTSSAVPAAYIIEPTSNNAGHYTPMSTGAGSTGTSVGVAHLANRIDPYATFIRLPSPDWGRIIGS